MGPNTLFGKQCTNVVIYTERERELQAEADHLNQLAQLSPACVRGEKWLDCSLSRTTHTPQVSQKSNFLQTPLVMFENQCISLQQCCRSRACRSAIFTMFALSYYLLSTIFLSLSTLVLKGFESPQMYTPQMCRYPVYKYTHVGLFTVE